MSSTEPAWLRELSPAERARLQEGATRLRREPGAARAPSSSSPAKAAGPTKKAAASRAATIAQAKAAEQDFLEALTSGRRAAFAGGRIAAPPRAKLTSKRVGLGYVRGGASDYDWFDGLSRAEQSRIRKNWMTDAPGAPAPDELEGAGLAMTEWLALTRGIDASRALQRRQGLSRARYGGRDPLAFLAAGKPADYGTPTTRVRKSTGDHGYVDAYGSSRVRFFTDKEGVVHPIRASYERPSSAVDRARADEYEEPF